VLGRSAEATTYDVNSRLDNPDVQLNGVCADINGMCTLRAAVMEAVADAMVGLNATIRLHAGLPYVLSQQGLPDDNTHGDLDIVGPGLVEIIGDGAATTV